MATLAAHPGNAIARSKPRTFTAGFVMEQTLGHVTHTQNLRRLLADEPGLDVRWLEVPFRPGEALYRLPPVSLNWSLRGSLYARRNLALPPWRNVDALFVHTMTIALLATPAYRQIPTVISIDATPRNIDSLGAAYSHHENPGPVESLKRLLIRRALRQAKAYVSWSEWAKDSLVKDYGVPADKILVAPPGTNLGLFRRPDYRRPGLPRLLFVGGDFLRKGGDLLLDTFRARLRGKAELHLVTHHPVDPEEGVFVYTGVGPNSPELLNLFHDADVFTLPTRADCLAVVLGEAMAASLPIVTTRVGAHAEAVIDGETGFVIAPDDSDALATALETLVENEALRERMGERARIRAETRFDAHRNALEIVDMMRSVAVH